MHYRRFSVTRIKTLLSRQPTYRLVLYGLITFLGLWAFFHSTASIPGSGLLWHPDSMKAYPKHYSPLVDVPQHVWENRAEQVRYAFLHAYGGYEEYAAPYDEILPLSKGRVNNFNGWGLTTFDSLDTMLIMGLEDQYKRGLEIVKQANFSVSHEQFAPFFETVIRYLGGLLSAYALSPEDEVLLGRAVDLVEKLDPVFNSTSGLAYFSVNPSTGTHRGPESGILAEVASLQLEYTYLAKLTGRKEHFHRANTVVQALSKANLNQTGGMLPIRWDLKSANPTNAHLSVGAQADSAHEYLLKLYLLTARTDKTSLEMYIRTTTHIISNLLYLSPTRHLLYVTDTTTPTFKGPGRPTHVFEHLSCFLPGLFALGVYTLPLDNLDTLGIDLTSLGSEANFGHAGKAYKRLRSYNLKQLHLWAAEGLAQTCWLTYADQPTGLGPDEMLMRTVTTPNPTKGRTGHTYGNQTEGSLWIEAVERWKKSGSRGEVPGLKEKTPVIYTEELRKNGGAHGRDYAIRKPGYLLRPETIESMYLLWRVTGDWKWRARGWAIFEAIQKETKTSCGYASLASVELSPARKQDSMPSYFLAETLKYLYLMFKTEDLIPLDQWVFNTEAHPLPVFE